MIAILRLHEAELRQAGIRRLSLFGFVARGDAEAGRDVDLAAEPYPEAWTGLFALGALERRLAELVGRKVDLPPEPVERLAELMPSQPWDGIHGMGNRLRHVCERISLNVIWKLPLLMCPSWR